MNDLTVEELAQLHQKLARWIGPRAQQTERTRRRPWVMKPKTTRAFEAFTHGNTCLAAGQWADATAAFERARALDPKRPYVAERLAEVARRQHAAGAPAPVAVGG
jgi:Tfp pilus assembly protein PilF